MMTIDQMRKDFEARFPVPSCSKWVDCSYKWRTSEEYDVFDAINRNHQQNSMFEVWQAAMQQAVPCVWAEDADGRYETSCGNLFELIDGTPADNDMRFCPYCGGKLAAVQE